MLSDWTKGMKNENIVVLNGSFQVMGKVSIEKAICLIYLGKAYSIKDSEKIIRSVSKTIPVPLVIVIPDAKYIKERNIAFSRRAVFERDKYVCVYCGCRTRNELTLDHLIPKSRFDEIAKKKNLKFKVSSFENCVTACFECNQKKSGKLISELGWPEIKPHKPVSTLDIDWDEILNA